MNTLKRTLALVATLAMAATAFASCGDKEASSSTSTPASSTEETTEAESSEEESSEAESSETESTGALDSSVGTGGDTFTVAAWNHDDVPALIASWKGLNADTIVEDLAKYAYKRIAYTLRSLS